MHKKLLKTCMIFEYIFFSQIDTLAGYYKMSRLKKIKFIVPVKISLELFYLKMINSKA